MSIVPRVGDTKFNVLTFIYEFRQTARYGPTMDEVAEAVGVKSKSTVAFHVDHLIDGGYVSHIPGKRRTLRVTPRGEHLIAILGGDK